jgi:very-short-patch-repair endonuclease/transposase
MKCSICDREFKNKGGYVSHVKTCDYVNTIKDEIITLYIDSFMGINEIGKKFNIGKNVIIDVLGNKKRTLSEGIKIARKKYPERYICSEETKEKIRIKRIQYMKDNPDKTAWRTSNLSYPEKLFLNKLELLNWGENYSIIREFCVFPYFIDFAFVNEKVAIEIDGSQHLLEDRRVKDIEKDELLINNGWSVIRISEKEVKTNLDEIMLKIKNILNTKISSQKYNLGLLSIPIGYQKKEKNTFGYTKSQFESSVKQRKVERPDFETLKKEINEYGFVKTGKKYGVSDNAIRKWLKFYEKTKESD